MDAINSTIIVSVAIMVGTTIVRHIREHPKDAGKGYVQPIAYGFLLTMALMLIALPFPTFAKGLALLGVVGALVVNGPTIYKVLGGA